MPDLLQPFLEAGFVAALLRIATPLLFATLGELFSERAGVLNLGIEGTMLLGAMVGFTAAHASGSLWLGILAAALAGAACGALLASFTVGLGVSQHVCGIGVTLLATGLAFFFYRLVFGQPAVPPAVVPFAPLPVPGLASLPWLGPALFQQTALTYLALLAVPLTGLVLFRTRWGLNLRTVGENPRAADAAGVNVAAMRTQAVVLAGALMGIGGAYLSLAQFSSFTFGVVSGRGWVCIALVVFGQWRPWRSAAGALLFALLEALQLRLQAANILQLPYEVFLMLPFVLTIAVMALVSRDARAPASLLIPFRKEER
ncbi:putative glucose ABC transporter permease protein TsgC13 [Rhodovastum atsumiense]|uniref:ABC transporter permease n=1 Tax=Rhodovastum atsumiense TaxID=504468 RepID=A0A5M6INM6_9PROT|nr:ABC transporter permease [Rhodovastum atsumiense]KAA5609509.1 ABC transporter permease [Rhodovastum atsumiense]CAH2600788.1 putative glucose ABC transporter permease protein TsgC13 [Rhodovastum atsumiense]